MAKKKVDENGDMLHNFSASTNVTGHVPITMPNFQTAEFCLKGVSPLVLHKFSHKAITQIMDKQSKGDQPGKKTVHEARDFNDDFMQARHISMEGWDGIAAPSFRNALIDSCKLCAYKMTMAKMSVFVDADGIDNTEGTPLVRILGGEPRMLTSMVRVGGPKEKVANVAVRPQWLEWGVRLRVRFDADQFSLKDITALVMRAGMQNGIGEGRPNSKQSSGQGWGLWQIVDETDPMFAAPVSVGSKSLASKAAAAGKKLEVLKEQFNKNGTALQTATQKRARKAAKAADEISV